MKKFFIIDAVNFLFRSYYAITPMTGAEGQSTHALFGFIRSLSKVIADFSPDYLVAVFDGPESKKSRTEIYQDYKSHRKKMPEDLFPQIEEALHFCKLSGIATLMISGVEADDTIGTLIKWSDGLSLERYICTSDKDLAQLVSPSTFLVHVHKDNKIVDAGEVFTLFGVHPNQIVDYLALVGDASDNIPGVEGIGPKTAANLLAEFGTLESLLEKASTISGKKGETLQNGKATAFLSKQLASLDNAVSIPEKLEFYEKKEPLSEELLPFFEKHKFLSLMKGMKTEEKLPPSKSYTLISSEEQLSSLLPLLQKQSSICIDTETSALSPMEASLVGIGLGYKAGEAWYIPLNGNIPKTIILDFLKTLLSTPHLTFYGHNIKYDLHILLNTKLPLPKLDFDTMIASYLLTPHIFKHNLDDLTLDHFNHKKIPIEDLIGKGKKQISMDKVPLDLITSYCCEDIDYTIRLKGLFLKDIEKKGLLPILKNIELPLIPILLEMERNGLFIDLPEILKLSHELSKKLNILEKKIQEFGESPININSPKQLGSLLFEKLGLKAPKKTQTGFSTSAETLESLENEHPIIPLILEYRQLEKLRSTYVDSLPEQVNPFTGRIHCTFNQSVAATGRLSCQSPNLQNIPIRTEEGKKIRTAFRPEKQGWSYLSADYSQIELRLLAHFSEDPTLTQAFTSGEDVHAYTASLIFNTPLGEVTPLMRHKAKAVNFGVLYGQQAFGLSKGLSIGYKEAAGFIEAYFIRYPKVKEYLESCKETARQTGYAITILGRQRPIPDMHSKNQMLRALAERLAINTPLQGSAADLIKMAMISIQKDWHFKNSMPILQIHDELLFECPEEELQPLSLFVKTYMEKAIPLKVPLIVDISIGKNWGDC